MPGVVDGPGHELVGRAHDDLRRASRRSERARSRGTRRARRRPRVTASSVIRATVPVSPVNSTVSPRHWKSLTSWVIWLRREPSLEATTAVCRLGLEEVRVGQRRDILAHPRDDARVEHVRTVDDQREVIEHGVVQQRDRALLGGARRLHAPGLAAQFQEVGHLATLRALHDREPEKDRAVVGERDRGAVAELRGDARAGARRGRFPRPRAGIRRCPTGWPGSGRRPAVPTRTRIDSGRLISTSAVGSSSG